MMPCVCGGGGGGGGGVRWSGRGVETENGKSVKRRWASS